MWQHLALTGVLASVFSIITLCSGATHDELPQCGLTGIYKTRQSVLESPNYPDNYPSNTCWDYVVRSPYRCPTKFHIQFLDFYLESSLNCSNDYLAIGLENDGDDMDVLCGQVIGIKKYHTPDGILRLRFFADDSPWTTGKGFKLLVTRLACEREDMLRDNLSGTDEDTVQVNAPTATLQPPVTAWPQVFRNLSAQEQHWPFATVPVFGWGLPPPQPGGLNNFYLPTALPQRPGFQVSNGQAAQSETKEKPCTPVQGTTTVQGTVPIQGTAPVQGTAPIQGTVPVQGSFSVPAYPPQYFLPQQPSSGYQPHPLAYQQLPSLTDQYPVPFQTQPQFRSHGEAQGRQNIDPQLSGSSVEACCTSSFRQKRFYLSSPGFPRTAFTSLLPAQQRDCQFHLEKASTSVCRLRVEFKFFDFGQAYAGTGDIQGNVNVAIATSRDVCTEDFLEIDNQRFCGCRTNFVYTALWGLGKKTLRMRLGYSGIATSGFLLEIFQEECRSTEFLQPQAPLQGGGQLPGLPGFGSTQQANGLNGNGLVNNGLVGNGLISNGLQGSNGLLGNGLSANGLTTNGLTTNGLSVNPQQSLYPTQQTLFGQQQVPFYQSGFYPGQQPNNLLQQNYPALQQRPSLVPQQFWSPQYLQAMLYQNQQIRPQFRNSRAIGYARSLSTQQPVSVVETNSTRKEYYYFDGDEAFARNVATPTDEPDADPDRVGLSNTPALRDRCSFSTTDFLRLAVDPLWVMKPICYSPQRSWFSNVFG